MHQKGAEHGNVGLDRAVGLNGNKAALGAKALSLRLDHSEVCVVDLRA